MKNILEKIKNFLKAHPIISSIGFVILIVVVVMFFNKDDGAQRVTVERGNIIETVQSSGKTKPAEDVELGFERSGKISRANVKIGDSVTEGQSLVVLDQSEQSANLMKAQADLAIEIARLEELKQASSNGEGDPAKISNAEVALRDATSNLVEKIRDSYTRADDAVRNYSGQFFIGNPPSIVFKDYFNQGGTYVYFDVDYEAKASVLSKRTALTSTFQSWAESLQNLNSTSDLNIYTLEAKRNLETVRAFLDDLSLIVNKLEIQNSEYRSIYVGFKSDVSAARSTVGTAVANLLAAQEKFNAARLDIGVSAQGIAAQESRVLGSRAQVRSIEAEISKMNIRAPFDGVVTGLDADQGEIVSGGARVISLISKKNFQIESNVSEVNIGKINPGNSVRITMDAFPGREFFGKVSYIEPAETLVDNVVTYKVTILLNEEYPDLKSGLTANLNIETARKDDVVVIPQYAIISRDGKNYARKIENNEVVEVEITLGTRGSDGTIEVLSGLSPQDVIEVSS